MPRPASEPHSIATPNANGLYTPVHQHQFALSTINGPVPVYDGQEDSNPYRAMIVSARGLFARVGSRCSWVCVRITCACACF